MGGKVASFEADFVMESVEASLTIAVLLVATFAVIGAHQIALVCPNVAIVAVTRHLRLIRLLQISLTWCHLAELGAQEWRERALYRLQQECCVLGIWLGDYIIP